MDILVMERGLKCQWLTLTGSKDIKRTPSECKHIQQPNICACARDLITIIPFVLFSDNY